MDGLTTPPKGDSYYILSKQYIAMLLNRTKNGGSGHLPPEVEAANLAAQAFFAAHKPGDVLTAAEKAQVQKWADLFEKYNTGKYAGVPHCGDDDDDDDN